MVLRVWRAHTVWRRLKKLTSNDLFHSTTSPSAIELMGPSTAALRMIASMRPSFDKAVLMAASLVERSETSP